MRIAIVRMYHETNTFALEGNDQLAPERIRTPATLPEPGSHNFIGGFLEVGQKHALEAVPISHAGFSHGGLISAKVFEQYRDMVVRDLRAAGKVDGVYFALHGAAAAAEPYTDAEGELIAACRAVVGKSVPFIATYDLHAIISPSECANLAAAFPHNTNPHIDGYERGLEAGECMCRTIKGEISPVTRIVHIPIIGPNIGQSTWAHDPAEEQRLPLYQLNRVREEMEKTPGIINLSILCGYGYADTPYSCMSVIAVADGDTALADRMAAELAARVWDAREQIRTVRPYYIVDEGVKRAMAHPDSPIVLVDLGDDPGSSCVADSPAVLESLIRQGASACALTIRDPNVVEAAMKAGIGATLEMEVGAAFDKRFYKPLKVRGKVKHLDDGEYPVCGPTHGGWGREPVRKTAEERSVGPRAVLRIGDKIDVIFSRGRTGKDRDFFKSAGIVLESKQILVVKSNQAHRASFDTVTAGNIDLASPGASTVDYAALPYRQLPRPMWPIDRDFDWSPPLSG